MSECQSRKSAFARSLLPLESNHPHSCLPLAQRSASLLQGTSLAHALTDRLLEVLKHLKTIFATPLLLHQYSGPTLPTALHSQRNLSTMSGTEQAIFANGWFVGLESDDSLGVTER
jgi:hypothetical protein